MLPKYVPGMSVFLPVPLRLFPLSFPGHINLGKKGYRVPPKGTIQVTLFNPNSTVVKMFVVQYDLSDMPPNSTTFLRQRTLYMPLEDKENLEGGKAALAAGAGMSAGMDEAAAHKWLRYLIHLR